MIRTSSALFSASAAHRELGPPVNGLVHDVRCREHRGQGDPRPQPARCEPLPRTENGEPDSDAEHQHDDEELVERAESGHRTGGEPPSSFLAEHGPHREQQRCRPDHEVDTRCQKHVTEKEGQRCPGHPPGCEGLREARTSGLPRDKRENRNGAHRAQQRDDPQGDDAIPECRRGYLGEQRGERRLVGVSPREGQHPEIQLIAVIPVERRQDPKDDREDNHGADDVPDGEPGTLDNHLARLEPGSYESVSHVPTAALGQPRHSPSPTWRRCVTRSIPVSQRAAPRCVRRVRWAATALWWRW